MNGNGFGLAFREWKKKLLVGKEKKNLNKESSLYHSMIIMHLNRPLNFLPIISAQPHCYDKLVCVCCVCDFGLEAFLAIVHLTIITMNYN